MPKPLGRGAKRWGLPTIGFAALACVGCCVLPLLAAGSILGGGLAVIHDSCLGPLAALMLAVGVAASVAWVRRRRKADRCGADVDCGCASDAEVGIVQPSVSRPRL
ncbi:MAG: hypothetical protein ABS80_17110 [Pseudonocardia sp. SCN 72-51]|nr:MAG: hypothetical protein ABS80_17110 [Pseudonocardia sp. SCN 72-51]